MTLDQITRYFDHLKPQKIDTIYIGGGTPNSMHPEVFHSLIEGLSHLTKQMSVREWTVEMNPEHVNSDQLKICADNGVSRLSIGVQSFSDKTLRFLNRGAGRRDAERAIRLIKDSWPGQWNMDLITSIPLQSRISSLEDAETAVACGPDHLSVYNLTIEPGTVLDRRRSDGEFRPSDADESAGFLKDVWEYLNKNGYNHYEVSNFARHDCESRHNLHYWKMHPYLGAGPGAVSTLPVRDNSAPVRLENCQEIETFIENTRSEQLTPNGFLIEYLMMGLRTIPGIRLSDFEAIFHTDLRKIIPGTLKKATRRNLVTIATGPANRGEDPYLSPTEDGMMLLDSILLDAVTEIDSLEPEITWPLVP